MGISLLIAQALTQLSDNMPDEPSEELNEVMDELNQLWEKLQSNELIVVDLKTTAQLMIGPFDDETLSDYLTTEEPEILNWTDNLVDSLEANHGLEAEVATFVKAACEEKLN